MTTRKEEADAKQRKIVSQWQSFAKTEAYQDLMQYCDAQREMLLNYAEERAMPHPSGKGIIPIDSETGNSLLQNRRGINIVRTYIRLRSE